MVEQKFCLLSILLCVCAKPLPSRPSVKCICSTYLSFADLLGKHNIIVLDGRTTEAWEFVVFMQVAGNSANPCLVKIYAGRVPVNTTASTIFDALVLELPAEMSARIEDAIFF